MLKVPFYVNLNIGTKNASLRVAHGSNLQLCSSVVLIYVMRVYVCDKPIKKSLTFALELVGSHWHRPILRMSKEGQPSQWNEINNSHILNLSVDSECFKHSYKMGQMTSASNTPGQDGPNNPEAAWWCKLMARIVGTIGGIVALLTGVWTCVTVSALCIIGGILQMLAGVVTLVFEAPICCTFIEATKPIATFAEQRTFFQKGIIFVAIAIPPIAMCFGLSTIFGSGLIFATGVVYGLMALGRKADRETMMANAQPPPGATTQQPPPQTWQDDSNKGLVDNTYAYSGEQNNPWANQKSVP